MSVKAMPSVGLVSLLPDGWVPCDDDDPRLEAAIESRSDEMLANPDDWQELLERAAMSAECREAATRFFHEFHSGESGEASKASRDFKVALSEIAIKAASEELEPT